MNAQYRVDSIFQDEELGDYFAKCFDLIYDEEFEKYLGLPDEYDGKQNASTLLKDSAYEMSDEVRQEIMTTFGVAEFDDEESFSYSDDFDDEWVEDDEEDMAYAESFNLREALNRIDLATDNSYDLLNLYEACSLSENEKKALGKIVYSQQSPEVIYDTLNNRFVNGEEIEMPERDKDGVIHEDEMSEGFTYDDTGTNVEVYSDYHIAKKRANELGLKMAEFGDLDDKFSYCFWNESGDRYADEQVLAYYKFVGSVPAPLDEFERQIMLDRYEKGPFDNEVESFDDEEIGEGFKPGDKVMVKPSKKTGTVAKVNGDYIEVEINGGKDPDRRDTFYPNDLEHCNDALTESTSMEHPEKERVFKLSTDRGDTVDLHICMYDDEESPGDYQISAYGFLNDDEDFYFEQEELAALIRSNYTYLGTMDHTDAEKEFNSIVSYFSRYDNPRDCVPVELLVKLCDEDSKSVFGMNESLTEDVNKEDLKAKLERATRDFVVNTLGYDDEFVNDYIVVSVTDSNFYEGEPAIKCEVRTELDYEECSRLAYALNPIVEAEDKQAYFDMETNNVTVAYLRTDFSDDVVEEKFVADFAPIIERVNSMGELRKLYQDIKDSFEGVWTYATFEAVHDLIMAKADELNGDTVTESMLTEAEPDENGQVMGKDEIISDKEVTEYTDNLLSNISKNYRFVNGETPICYVAGAGVGVRSNNEAYLEIQAVEEMGGENIEIFIDIPVEAVTDIKTFKSKCEKLIIAEFEKEFFRAYKGAKKVSENLSGCLKEDINDPDEVLDFKRNVEAAEDLVDIENLIWGLSDGVAEDAVQRAFNENEDAEDLQTVKDAVIREIDIYLEDNEWLGESLFDDYDEDKPYTYTQVYDELKLETRNFTIDGDTIQYGYISEAEYAEKILKRHYASVVRNNFRLTFKDCKHKGSR